jgi:DNA-binding NarL/FixJ family response regulator
VNRNNAAERAAIVERRLDHGPGSAVGRCRASRLASRHIELDQPPLENPPFEKQPLNNKRVDETVPQKYSGAGNLGSTDLRALLDYTEQILSVNDPAAVPQLLSGLAALVGADAASLTRIDLRSGSELAVLWPESRVNPDVLAGYAAVSGTHPVRPLLAQQARSAERRPAPIRISDVLSHRQWRGTALYSASHSGIDDQMCGLIGARGSEIQALVLSRYDGLFTDRQAAVFGAGREHLMAAVRRMGQQTRRILQVAPQLRWVTAPVGIPHRQLAPAGQHADGDPLTGPTVDVGRLTHATTRQREILSFAGEGLTDAQIGRKLGLSSATVSKHLSRAYTRLGVPNRAAAVRLLSATPAR